MSNDDMSKYIDGTGENARINVRSLYNDKINSINNNTKGLYKIRGKLFRSFSMINIDFFIYIAFSSFTYKNWHLLFILMDLADRDNNVNVTQHQLSKLTGMTQPNICNMLKKFKKMMIIIDSKSKRGYVINRYLMYKGNLDGSMIDKISEHKKYYSPYILTKNDDKYIIADRDTGEVMYIMKE